MESPGNRQDGKLPLILSCLIMYCAPYSPSSFNNVGELLLVDYAFLLSVFSC